MYKCLFGSTDINVLEHTSSISHGHTRQSKLNSFNLKTPLCRTITFKASYFNLITNIIYGILSVLLSHLVVSLVHNLLNLYKTMFTTVVNTVRWKDLAHGL